MTRRLALATLAAAALGSGLARAQEPQPVIRDVRERSGLFTRFTAITPNLPPDRDRDKYYVTRWGNETDSNHQNSIFNGGLYGRPKWKSDCTACFSPSFRGSTGASTLGPHCDPGHPAVARWITNAVHPFKPVDHYYAGGCYVPVYDLDYFVPGPGTFPFGRIFQKIKGG